MCPDEMPTENDNALHREAQVCVQNKAITDGPSVTWNHIDGPLLHWAGELHWLTPGERLRIFFRLTTVDQVACKRWPHLATLRSQLDTQAVEVTDAARY